MANRILVISLLLFYSVTISAQSSEDDEAPKDPLHLSILIYHPISHASSCSIVPLVGIENNKHAVFLGPKIIYDRDPGSKNYGLDLFYRFSPFKTEKPLNFHFFFHSEYIIEMYNQDSKINIVDQLGNIVSYPGKRIVNIANQANHIGYGIKIKSKNNVFIQQSLGIGIVFDSYKNEFISETYPELNYNTFHPLYKSMNGSLHLSIGFGYEF